MKIIENVESKAVVSQDYNYLFNKKTGNFVRWGKSVKDDPERSPSPEIADIEITDICGGVGDDGPCSFCYKANTATNKKNMSFELYKSIIDKLKIDNLITQVAFGADAKCTSNPDLFKMAEYTRSIGIIPNITVADITQDTANKLASVMGAVAVSRYVNKNYCYDSVKRLVDAGMKQVNIHQLVHSDNIEQIKETLDDVNIEPRLTGLNAVVLLSLKQKGRGVHFQKASVEQFREIVNYAFSRGVRIGFDSCSAGKFLEAVKDRPDFKNLEMMSEKCESTLFSIFINVDGKAMPCSFCDGVVGWQDGGIDVTAETNFRKDIWDSSRFSEFRSRLLDNCRNCPVYDV